MQPPVELRAIMMMKPRLSGAHGARTRFVSTGAIAHSPERSSRRGLGEVPMIVIPVEKKKSSVDSRRRMKRVAENSKPEDEKDCASSQYHVSVKEQTGEYLHTSLAEREKMEIRNWQNKRTTSENLVILGYLFGVTLGFFLMALLCNVMPYVTRYIVSSFRFGDNSTYHLLSALVRCIRSSHYCLTL